MRTLIGWGCGAIAAIAGLGLAYAVTFWRFGDRYAAYIDGDD